MILKQETSNLRTKQKPPFKEVESYKHKAAKDVLEQWLKDDYIKIVPEEKFCLGGYIWFVPDLTCYTEEGVRDMYEIVHTSDVSHFKQWKMQQYFDIHNWNVNVFRVDAEWILKHTQKPASIDFQKII